MDAIIAQFLDYARASADEAPVVTNVRQLLDEIAARYARLGAPLQLQCGEIADTALRPLAIRRALGNLIENARKYALLNTGDDEITWRRPTTAG